MADREKSALYPGATWSDCLDFIQKISSFNLKAVSYQEIAKKYGLSSTTTKSFTAKIGAAKQFGLISTSQGTIQLTDASKRLLFPTGEPIREIELQCFSQPPLYANLIKKFDGSAIPQIELLSNILMSEYRITRGAKDSAAKCFLESANQLGLIHGGVLFFSDAQNVSSSAEALPEESLQSDGQSSKQESPVTISTPLISEADYITQTIPCAEGKIARISIPINATDDDLYLIHDMLEIIMKRRFKISIDQYSK